MTPLSVFCEGQDRIAIGVLDPFLISVAFVVSISFDPQLLVGLPLGFSTVSSNLDTIREKLPVA